MQAVISAIDAQTAAGTIEIGTAGMATLLVSMTLAKPSFTESGGVITLAGAPISANAAATGTGASARIKDGVGTVIVSGLTVGTSAADINLNSVSITTGQAVTLNSGTITHSP
jgi:hypothetical protein